MAQNIANDTNSFNTIKIHDRYFFADYASTCSLPEDVGSCEDTDSALSTTRWRYNPALQTCVQFVFSGCRGNRNNFVTESECARRCVQMRVVPEGEIWWPRECDIVITSSSSSLISISLSDNPTQTLHINGRFIWVSENLPYSSVDTARLFKCMYDELSLIFQPWGNNLRFML
mgnify:FL=1